MTIRTACTAAALSILSTAALADSWPMRQHDAQNTGRAFYNVPAARQNSGLFGVFAWQTPSPGSPGAGNLSASSMVFFDGVGPGNTDVVVSGYHWPKGVQGLDRHTGRRLWSGNPAGGETIGRATPAFSTNGRTIYVVNDATESSEFPNGHPLMAFASATGPGAFWHNGGSSAPWKLSAGSPRVSQGKVFLFSWNDRPHGATDDGSQLTDSWDADAQNATCFNEPAFYVAPNANFVVSGGRFGVVRAYGGAVGNTIWSQNAGRIIEATATVDPDTGRVYVPAGDSSVDIVCVAFDGTLPWGVVSKRVFTNVPGENSPQRAQSGGCLSFDGSTYYFQTVAADASGALYAINTSNGTIRWALNTGSQGGEGWTSSPIVTANNIIFVGNNAGGTYYAIKDNGTSATVLDTFAVDPGAGAFCTPTLSSDGMLYLPLRTLWLEGNADGDVPSATVHNLYSAFDLRAGATPRLPAPPAQAAFVRNAAVLLTWNAVTDPSGIFDHYNVYRATSPFSDTTGLTPIASIPSRTTVQFLDQTATNGVHYYYAVTSVATGGGETRTVASIGPRTPRDETDLQILNIARTPRFPRYAPNYDFFEVTEPSGFGPYYFTSSTSLGNGQTASTPRWPSVGQQVTYTATIRNRGTNTWTGNLSGVWRIDGAVVASPSQGVDLDPGETATFSLPRVWDDQLHDVSFSLSLADARPINNALTVGSKSVGFLTYADKTFLEEFREDTTNWSNPQTDDLYDWLNQNLARFNQIFVDAGIRKRVHYEVLDTLDDAAPDPSIDTMPFAIFPFRYHNTDGDPRLSGYYRPDQDIDFGLLHEMGHQLGIIDLYQFDIPPENNLVSGLGYTAPECLMRSCAPALSRGSALAMEHWLDKAHGYYGQYMYGLPATIRMKFLSGTGAPLSNATITMYQLAERPGLGKVISTQAKASGTTDSQGVWTLPNVPINPVLMPPAFNGDTLHANPFGYVAVVGTNVVLHFKVEKDGFTDYAWLDITEPNIAFYEGATQEATFERMTHLGGTVERTPPNDMAELNADSWEARADGGTYTVLDDSSPPQGVRVGAAAIRADTNGGFDTYLRYPGDRLALWDLSQRTSIRFWVYATNPNGSFQNGSPWITLRDPSGGSFVFESGADRLNGALGQWLHLEIPLAGGNGWTRRSVGTPSLGAISSMEIHADTWGAGFTLWLDGVGFDPPSCTADFNHDGQADFFDYLDFAIAFDAEDPSADTDGNGQVDFFDYLDFVAAFNEGC